MTRRSLLNIRGVRTDPHPFFKGNTQEGPNVLFSSIPFLYYFLPPVLILYFLVPARVKNAVLLSASLFFYGWGEPKFLVMMVLSILAGYVFGLLIDHADQMAAKKLWLVLSVSFSIFMLGWFKYVDFFIVNFHALTGLSTPLFKIALPIGISFYTFQLLSYTVDVYRGETPAQKNPITLAAYVALFPQLIAGPIVRYSDVASQLNHRRHSFEMIAEGIRRFVFGISKKVLIANALGELCNTFRGSTDQSVLFFWMYAAAFTLHIYFDFSGYSDMAIGLGRIFGLRFLENFNYPYIASSITDFWRRWHISLGSWFRDYVYIPMGGNRVSKARWLFNILAVWFLTGFWHGAAWNFIAWGLFYAVLLVLEKLWLLKKLEPENPSIYTRFFRRVYVMFFVIIGFVIFNAESMGQAMADLSSMFGLSGANLTAGTGIWSGVDRTVGKLPFTSVETMYHLRSYLVTFLIAVIAATPLPRKLVQTLRQNDHVRMALDIAEPLILMALMFLVTACLVDGSFNPFLYFRF